jgi:hydroxymethylpyrimidine pyrophosphatase-like HAD family hydrolase
MQMPTVVTTTKDYPESERGSSIRNSERAFYEQYAWCLNAFPTMAEVIDHLREELGTLDWIQDGWRRAEVLTNIFLLSCAVSDTVDDYLGGPRYDFSQVAQVFRPCRRIVRLVNWSVRCLSDIRSISRRRLRRWRDQWETAVIGLTTALALHAEAKDLVPDGWRAALVAMLDYPFPAKLKAARQRIPAAFRSQDLTHFDGLRLGQKLSEECPDRSRPILVVGLRTAGSYFAPLLRGYLESKGYHRVQTITLRPKQGPGLRERSYLARAVATGALAAVVDEPVYLASTMAMAVDRLKKTGFPPQDILAVFPAHPFRRNWRDGSAGLALSAIRAVTLEPEEWRKHQFLGSSAVQNRIREYLEADGERVAELQPSADARRLTAELDQYEEPGLHWRLKRIYEVGIANGNGSVRKFVLAKSVGWGWMGYHALLAGARLGRLVPRVLGLRDGVLFMEWQPHSESNEPEPPVESTAQYLAERVGALRLGDDPTRDLAEAGRHRGTEELAGVLSGAYGWKLAAVLKRPRLQHQLAHLACPVPTLIDGKMRRTEWVRAAGDFLKTDFEHHGMGKHELNVADPAYDLAEMILHWELSEDDERRLIQRYIDLSADRDVPGRLFLQKLLAGTWAMNQAIRKLSFPSMGPRREELNREFLQAWRFLIIHTMRFCANLGCRPENPRWSEPLTVLDVDGVLDKQIFGFPSTTAAGIEAVSLLASHGFSVALNTARSVSILKEYCRTYGFVGGVAEYGSYIWDATTGREQVLVTPESLGQMKQLKNRLREIPGVFFDEDCQFIIRAYAYTRNRTVPLPETLIRALLAELEPGRFCLHQTYTDSTVIAAECNKGEGLRALLSLAGHSGWETSAVGDSEPDLAMFHAATRCFAPSQIGCPGPARLLGCQIATRPYQLGLLEIVRSLVHPDGKTCHRCRFPGVALSTPDRLFRQLLHTADQSTVTSLIRSLLDPRAIRAFLR